MGRKSVFLLKALPMSHIEMTAVFEPSPEGGYIAYIEEIPGINSQGESLEEAKENLADAITLVFEQRRFEKQQEESNSYTRKIKQTLSFSL